MIGGQGPGGLVDFKPNTDEFLASQRTLFYGARAGGLPTDQAKAAIEAFRASISAQGGLTSDAIAQLQKSSPPLANRMARTLSPLASGVGGFRDAGDLGNYLDQWGPVPEKNVNRLLAQEEPNAKRDADATRGVSDAFDALRASAGRLTEAFGSSSPNLVKAIDGVAKIIDDMAGKAAQFGTGRGAKTFDDVINGKDGDLMGRLGTYAGNHAGDIGDFLLNGPEFLRQTPEAVVSKFTGAPPPPAAAPVLPVAPQPQAQGIPETPQPYTVEIADPTAPQGRRRVAIPTDEGEAQAQQSIPTELPPPQQRSAVDDQAAPDATRGLAELDGAASETSAALSGLASDLRTALDGVQHGSGSAISEDKAGKFADGGHISGPGSATSDSIPARLSDGEYVMSAGATAAVGVKTLDALNAESRKGGGGLSRLRRAIRGYADGGEVSNVLGPGQHKITYDPDTGGVWIDGVQHFAGDPILDSPSVQAEIERSKREQMQEASQEAPTRDGGTIGNAKESLADLGPGDHSITFDPNTGGAVIDGVLHYPGDPLLDDPTVRQEIQKSKQDMKEPSQSKTHKSLFTGPFGGRVFGTPGSYADGGSISGPGTSTSDSIPAMLSDGEFVVNAGATRKHLGLLHAINGNRKIGLGHFAIGGPVGLMGDIGLPQVSGSSSIVGGGGTSEALHHVTIDLGVVERSMAFERRATCCGR